MNATQTLPLPVARPMPPMPPAPSRPAPPVPLPTSPRASDASPPAGPGLDVAPPPSHLAGRVGAERSRVWETRVVFGSVLVLAVCTATGLASHATTEPESSPLVTVVATLGIAALEGWRRARRFGTEAAALQAALRATRESERWYRAVVNDVVDAVLVASPEGRLVEVNRAATVLLGRERDWLMGRRLWDLLPLDERLVALRRGDTATTQGGGLRRLLRSDGSEVLADVSWHTHDDGRMVYLARRFSRW